MKRILGTATVAIIVLAACGGGSKTSPSASARPRPAGPASGGLEIGTRSVPGIGTVLVDTKGFTLYHLKTESGTNIDRKSVV